MIYKLSIQQRHFRIYDKLCLLSGLISAHRRESWVFWVNIRFVNFFHQHFLVAPKKCFISMRIFLPRKNFQQLESVQTPSRVFCYDDRSQIPLTIQCPQFCILITFSLSLSLSHTLAHSHTQAQSHTHTYTQTHSLILAFFPSCLTSSIFMSLTQKQSTKDFCHNLRTLFEKVEFRVRQSHLLSSYSSKCQLRIAASSL